MSLPTHFCASDLVFIQDCTGSQGSYISAATKNIEIICDAIYESGKLQAREDLRVGLVAYRDHPPQDHTYVTKNFGFTSDITTVQNNLKTLYASGGGDGPEAVTAAMAEALHMDWRENASKMVVLIADAPSHGIGEFGDGKQPSVQYNGSAYVSQVLMADLLMETILWFSHVTWQRQASPSYVHFLHEQSHHHNVSLNSSSWLANLR
jgi:hypothetical protein